MGAAYGTDRVSRESGGGSMKEQLEFLGILTILGAMIIGVIMCTDKALQLKKRSCLEAGGSWIEGVTYESHACILGGKK